MKTHTIRGKFSQTPIMKLTPKFLDMMLDSYPEAASITLEWFTTSYRRVSGKVIHFDYDQRTILLQKYGADSNGKWVSKFSKLDSIPYGVVREFEAGLKHSISYDFETVLQIANEFYSMMDSRYFKEKDGI